MGDLIKKFKKTFRMYLSTSNVVLNEKQKELFDDLFKKIMNEFEDKCQWCAPEMVVNKAVMVMYRYVPFAEDEILNEHMRIYWNRFITRYYLKKDFEFSNTANPYEFYKIYSKKFVTKSISRF